MTNSTMRTTGLSLARGLTVVALAAALAACSAEQPAAENGAAPAGDPPAAETAEATQDGPAGEVAAESREPADAAGEVAEAASEEVRKAAQEEAVELPGGLDPKSWGVYWKHIDFRLGSEAGLAEAEKTGKPMMIFYTATW